MAAVAGVIDDRASVAGELSLPPDAPQHVLAAVAYTRLHAKMLSRLRGAFALVVWDQRRRDGILAVDQLGARSLVYRRGAASLLFATDVRELLPLLETAPPPSEGALVRWLVEGVQMPEETLLSGIERLPGGHLLHLGGGMPRRERYWARCTERPSPWTRLPPLPHCALPPTEPWRGRALGADLSESSSAVGSIPPASLHSRTAAANSSPRTRRRSLTTRGSTSAT